MKTKALLVLLLFTSAVFGSQVSGVRHQELRALYDDRDVLRRGWIKDTWDKYKDPIVKGAVSGAVGAAVKYGLAAALGGGKRDIHKKEADLIATK